MGRFLKKSVAHVWEGGYLVFLLPYPHWDLQGGHVAVFSPQSVIYSLALTGLDCSRSSAIGGHGEFSIFVQVGKVRDLSELQLSMDFGDIAKIAESLPPGLAEGSSAFELWGHLGLMRRA